MSGGYEGGCLCGAIRYRIDGALSSEGAGFCHCRICQRATGAPVVAWGTFHRRDFTLTRGTPAEYRSSPKAVRQFCAACGTALTFAYTEAAPGEPPLIDVTLSSLDDPAAIVPTYHIWTSSRVPWLDPGDALPRHPDGGPDYTPY